MLRTLAKSKIHGATVTQTELHYEGSITLPADLMQLADIVDTEQVQIVNLANGARLETYVIEGPAESGGICLNGPAARLAAVGDMIHIISYGLYNEQETATHRMKTVLVDAQNKPV